MSRIYPGSILVTKTFPDRRKIDENWPILSTSFPLKSVTGPVFTSFSLGAFPHPSKRSEVKVKEHHVSHRRSTHNLPSFETNKDRKSGAKATLPRLNHLFNERVWLLRMLALIWTIWFAERLVNNAWKWEFYKLNFDLPSRSKQKWLLTCHFVAGPVYVYLMFFRVCERKL